MQSRLSATIAALTLALYAANAAGPDMKFIKEAANIVWGTPNPVFDPKAELTDSIFDDCSAAFIAIENVVEGRHKPATSVGNTRISTETRYVGENVVDSYSRKMVKLYDAKAIESFSEFEFDEKIESQNMGYLIYGRKEAFGARIYKPDGRVIDIDMSKALPVTEGKKNKVTGYKIAIPGLEPGDVLDYFLFLRTDMLGNQRTGKDVSVMMTYPIANYTFRGKFENTLNVEIYTFNDMGRELFQQSADGENNYLSFNLQNIERFDNPKYCNMARQIPYFRVSVADNRSQLFPTMKSARQGGLYVKVSPVVVMWEIAERFANITLPQGDANKAWGIVKDYMQSHPDAKWEEIADATWLACLHTSLESKENYDDWDITALFKDVADKCKFESPVKLAVSCPRTEVPIMDIGGYDQATPMVMIGKRAYYLNANTVYMPGEISGPYQGEQAYTFSGSRNRLFENRDTNMELITLPDSKYNQNTETTDVFASIDLDNNDRVNFSYTNKATGALKDVGSSFLTRSDITEMAEDYLNIADKKRSKRKFDKLAIDDDRREALEKMPEFDLDLESCKVDSVAILNPGFLPGNAAFEYEIQGSTEGLVTRAGDDLLLKIGNLAGVAGYTKVDRDKPREIDIYAKMPYNHRYNLTIDVPEGYSFDPASLEQLQTNVVNLCGSFFTQATYDADSRKITIITNFRNNRRYYPLQVWDSFLDLRDAGVAFADTTLVFTKD